jgi:tetratricopeptide (TPR) repeat protein
MTKNFCLLVPAFLLLTGCSQEPRFSTHSPQAIEHFTNGMKQRERFYFREAAQEFHAALVADSGFAMAWTGIAMVFFQTDHEVDAKRTIVLAMQKSQQATRWEQLYVRMWDERIAYRRDEAMATAESLVAISPKEESVYQFLGELANERKDIEGATRWFQKALDLDSTYAIAVMSLGYAYSDLGDPEKAITQMKRYIQLEPDAADPRASLADLLLRAGRYDEALEQYHASLSLKPDYWYAFSQIGRVYLTLGRLHEAEDQIRQSLKLLSDAPQNEATLLTFLGNLDMMRGKFEEGLARFTNALGMDSTMGGAAFSRALALARLHRFKEASGTISRLEEELHKRNLQGTSAMVQFHVLRSRVLQLENRLPEAEQACKQALDLSGHLDRLDVFRQLGEVRLALHDNDGALDACEGALTINPNHPMTLLTLTRVYHATHDRAMMKEIGGRLLQLWSKADPDFLPLKELRALKPGA